MDKKVKEMVKEYEKNGWFLSRKNGKHYIYKHKNGGTVTISGSSSDKNAFWSVRRHFKKEERKWDIN